MVVLLSVHEVQEFISCFLAWEDNLLLFCLVFPKSVHLGPGHDPLRGINLVSSKTQDFSFSEPAVQSVPKAIQLMRMSFAVTFVRFY